MCKYSFKTKKRKSRARTADSDDFSIRVCLYADDKFIGSRTFDTKKQARVWGTQRVQDLNDGVTTQVAKPKAVVVNFNTLVDEYLASADEVYGGKNQKLQNQRAVLWWKEHLGTYTNIVKDTDPETGDVTTYDEIVPRVRRQTIWHQWGR
ncbi:MAG: hypothetical protein P8P79_00875, partial [Halioglobus sp.]|nr:hypothetical protein [Halioglobus sp.]